VPQDDTQPSMAASARGGNSSTDTEMHLLGEMPVGTSESAGRSSGSLPSLPSVNCLKMLADGVADASRPGGSDRGRPSLPSLQAGLYGLRSASEKDVHGLPATCTDAGVPVYVMLPLDTVTAKGVLRYKTSPWFNYALQSMRDCGVRGVAVDVWWGAVERSPGVYNWDAYKVLVEDVKALGLKLQVVLSFHACGGNVGDYASIPLPPWVLKAGEADPDLFFTDRPRGTRRGQRNKECLSFFADDAPALEGRTPVQCYSDFMQSFAKAFDKELGSVIDDVIVGSGPCGELRYPSYVEANGWSFPGVGEFQCYDRRALEQLAKAAEAEGHPEWGRAGPHDAGCYNSLPEDTGFFNSEDGSWDSPYGRFFMKWYSGCLLAHGRRLLEVATSAFRHKMKPARSSLGQMSVDGDHERNTFECLLNPAADTSGSDSNRSTPPGSTSEDDSNHSAASSVYGMHIDSSGSVTHRAPELESHLAVTFKIAGIHWHYRTQSHAAELTAGYYNTAHNDGYAPLIQLCAEYGAGLTLTCVEMCDAQHPRRALCSPEGLLYQVRRTASQMDVSLAGENALPCFSPGGVDATALDRIIRNTRGYDPTAASPSMVMSEYAPSGSSGRLRRVHGTFSSIGGDSTCSSSTDMVSDSGASDDSDELCSLPPMRNFTFLRLNQEMIAPAYQGVWMRFMQRMHATSDTPSGYRLSAAPLAV